MCEILGQNPLNNNYTLQKMKDRKMKEVLSGNGYSGRGEGKGG
jgi:hypothetical protein